VLKSLNLKAIAMKELGKHDAALRYHRKIYGKGYDVLGPDHRYTDVAASSLADNLSVIKDPKAGSSSTVSLEEAAKLYKYVLESAPARSNHIQTS